jgi:peroxiredoxin
VSVGPGQAALEFDLPTAGGGRARLADYKSKPLVVYFYPTDNMVLMQSHVCVQVPVWLG